MHVRLSRQLQSEVRAQVQHQVAEFLFHFDLVALLIKR